VRAEMDQRGVPASIACNVLDRVAREGNPDELLGALAGELGTTRQGPQGIAELSELFEIARALGVPPRHLALDLRLVRGLDYYTGPVYESIVTTPAIGSLTGGGRYDDLLGKFTGQPLPAVGTSIGLERIIEVMKEFSMFPETTAGTEILVTIFDPATRDASLALAAELRRAGLRCEVALKPAKGLRPQINYASSKGIPLIAVLGPDEIGAGQVVLRAGADRQLKVGRGDAAAAAGRMLAELRGAAPR
jgi:histidyl-tRNA synthetase